MEDRRSTGRIGPGTRVEVRSGYRSSWASGFEVAGVDGERYRLRRVSDGQVLPEVFDPDALRRENSLDGS